MNAWLSIEGLCTWYAPEALVLKQLSLHLEMGEVVGLIGLNGAGKTTLINVLSGLHDGMCAETVRFEGAPISFRDAAFKRKRYTVFAEDAAFGYFSFREYLTFVARAYGQPLMDADALVEGFHFNDYVTRPLRDLSTGNRKKAFLITAFALCPPLLLLDEPVNGLDFQSTEFLYTCLRNYRAHGTVLFSSHVLESIVLTADRVLVLEEGRIAQTFAGDAIDSVTIREATGHDDV